MLATIAYTAAVCRHCRRPDRKVNRPKGLCWRCWEDTGIRDRYESQTAKGRRSYANGYMNGTMPVPTDALPGTREKLDVMQRRAMAGERLHHPLDATR